MMNPNNKSMEEVSYGSGSKEVFFSWEISKNFPFVMKIVGIICFICHTTACFMIRNSENIKANFMKVMRALFSGNKEEI